jgi:hypothetical protein
MDKITLNTVKGTLELTMGLTFSARLTTPHGWPVAGFEVETMGDWEAGEGPALVLARARAQGEGEVEVQCVKLYADRWSLMACLVRPDGRTQSFVAAEVSSAEVDKLRRAFLWAEVTAFNLPLD